MSTVISLTMNFPVRKQSVIEMIGDDYVEMDKVQYEIGRLIAENLVEDGSTLQAGIGVIPDAVMANLKGHKGLGVHSEMFSDGMIDLIQSGAITNEHVCEREGSVKKKMMIMM